jgi:uncharacterized membrane protein YfcA
MTLPEIAIFFGVSFLASAINSVAGGGTFLTFPVFILNGLTAAQANIMSTIALWPGVLASMYGYRGELKTDKKQLLWLLVIGAAGGIVGAAIFLLTPEITFAKQVPWLLLAATLIFTFGRHLVTALHRLSLPQWTRQAMAVVMQLVIALYGGYFGAGIGILTLAMLQLIGFSHIHQMNALKTVLTGVINLGTVLVFIASGKVLWSMGLVMILGAVLGGYIGARTALHVAPQRVRLLVSCIGFAMTGYFFLHGA